MFQVEPCEIEKQIAVHIRRGDEHLAELHSALSLRIRRDPLERSQQNAIAHAVSDEMHLLRAAVRGEVDEKLGDGPLAGLVGGIGRDAAV